MWLRTVTTLDMTSVRWLLAWRPCKCVRQRGAPSDTWYECRLSSRGCECEVEIDGMISSVYGMTFHLGWRVFFLKI